MLTIDWDVCRDLRSHAEQAYPHECCGVLLGRIEGDRRIVTRAVRCTNACDSPANRYSIAPKELIRVQLDSREEGLAILGFYHSHPDHTARWSPTDLEEAHWLGCSYVITELEQGRAVETLSYLLSGDREEDKRFIDEEISMAERVEEKGPNQQ